MVFDGRLDYREDIANGLALGQQDLRSLSDASLAMLAFEKWGQDIANHLDGDFALIVWDRAEQRLTAVRDRMGLRALSYHVTPDRLIVATLPDAFFALGVARRIDAGVIADKLAGNPCPPGRSLYTGIVPIGPAHRLVATRDRLDLSRYWQLDRSSALLALKRDEDYVEAARDVFTAAVRTRMRSIGKVGADLSGGLDSSTTAVTALQLLPEGTLPVFTQVPEAGWSGAVTRGRYADETPFVRDIVAMHPRLSPTFVENHPAAWDRELADYFRIAQSIWVLPRYLQMFADTFRAARDLGVTTLLNGGSGNISLTWNGPGAFGCWFAERRFRKIAEELRLISDGRVAFLRGIVSRVLVPAGPDWLWRVYARVKYGKPDARSMMAYSFLNPARLSELSAVPESFHPRPEADYRATRAIILTPDDDHDFAHFHNWARTVHRIDYRDPFRDRRVAEWSLRVPEEQFYSQGQARWLIKRMMAGRLPESVLHNPLRGAAEGDWHYQMTRQVPLMREQLDVMADDPDVAALLDIGRIRQTLDDWPKETPVDPSDPRIYTLPAALPYALAAGRFVRWAKGANL